MYLGNEHNCYIIESDMDIWEEKFNIKKPDTCNRTAICCQMATALSPWEKLFTAKNNPSSKDFFSIFLPYPKKEMAREKFPDVYYMSLEVAKSRPNTNIEDLYFYYCRFLSPPDFCLIYEDRPSLCRGFPESPFDSISIRCGYFKWAKQCQHNYHNIKSEYNTLQLIQKSKLKFFLLSPGASWIK